jgi:hypothetical protein
MNYVFNTFRSRWVLELRRREPPVTINMTLEEVYSFCNAEMMGYLRRGNKMATIKKYHIKQEVQKGGLVKFIRIPIDNEDLPLSVRKQ